MFKTFKDENAELMRKLSTEIADPTERFASAGSDLAKTGPISSQFFPQPEVNVELLDTETLLDTMPGGQHGLIDRFREQMKALYPTMPWLWNLPRPMAGNMQARPLPTVDANAGGTHWPSEGKASRPSGLSQGEKDALAGAARNAEAAGKRALVTIYAKAFEKALAARA